MIHSRRVQFSARILAAALALSASVALLVSCNSSTGTETTVTLQPQTFTYTPGGSNVAFLWTAPNVSLTATPEAGATATSYTVTPALPAGLSLNASTGVISGTPTTTHTPTAYKIANNGPGAATDTSTIYLGVFESAYPFPLLAKGKTRFPACAGCHGSEGKGSQCPHLNPSNFLMADKHRPIRIQLMGLPNPVDTSTNIVVNGETISGNMSAQGNGDSTIAGVLTFVRAYFNGATDFVTVDEVSQVRDSVIKANTDHNWGLYIEGHADY